MKFLELQSLGQSSGGKYLFLKVPNISNMLPSTCYRTCRAVKISYDLTTNEVVAMSLMFSFSGHSVLVSAGITSSMLHED